MFPCVISFHKALRIFVRVKVRNMHGTKGSQILISPDSIGCRAFFWGIKAFDGSVYVIIYVQIYIFISVRT